MRPSRANRPPQDSQRFAELWEQHAWRVQAYAMRHVDPDTAQEVVSETFLVAWRRLADVPGQSLPWLLVVARNTIKNQRRSHYRARAVHEELARLTWAAAPHGVGADALVAERDLVLRALATLTWKEREALLLVAWDGLTPGEAAKVAGCSPGTFKVRLHRARQRLNEACAESDSEAEPAQTAQPVSAVEG